MINSPIIYNRGIKSVLLIDCSPECKAILEDKLSEVASSLIAAYDNGEFISALEEGHSGWQKWVKSFGKSLKRKVSLTTRISNICIIVKILLCLWKFTIQGKSLFMPLRVLLTGKVHGPDMGEGLLLIYKAGRCGAVAHQSGFVPLDERFKMLREVKWDSLNKDSPSAESANAVVVSN